MVEQHGLLFSDLIHPLAAVMERFGIDPHVGVDILFVSILLLLLSYIGGRPFRKSDNVEPEIKLSFSSILEIVVDHIYRFSQPFLGKYATEVFPIIGSIIFFILFNNLIGLVPGFNPPTDQFSTTIILGLLIFFITHITGFYVHGGKYIYHFTGPVWWLSWLIFPIEIISHLVRPISLALRLFGNMTGDHKVTAVFFGLLPFLIPVPILGLGVFVCFVQTFVFILLSLVYLSEALEHHH